MPPTDDMELLQDYGTRQSERAFEELVRRHINFVYSSALRQVGNPHLAEEVTQATFTILAQKAATLKPNTVLSGWLFNTVRFVAAAEFRRAARRKKHEQEAVMESWTQENNPDTDWQHWQQVGPLLDECLAQLSEKDRQVVLLRFLEQKSFMEVGALLGTNADTATKRAKRAVEKLRQLFIKRGIVLSVAAIATVLSAHGVQAAPAGLAGPVVATALIHGATATTSTTTLIKGALKLMAWTKIKTTVVAVGVMLAFGAATITVTEMHNHGSGGRIRYFSDGSFIRLLSSSYGTYFSYKSPGVKPWQSSLARRLPSGIASQFDWWMGNNGSVSMSSPSGVTNLAVIIAGERPSHSLPPQALMVVDQEGDESMAAFSGSTVGYDDGKHFKTIQMWELSAFPRRAKTLDLRFIRSSPDTNSKPTMAEFQIPNPAFRNYPVWTPEPLPATQTDGDLSVTLVGLTTGLTFDNPEVTAALGEVPATRATFHLELPGHRDQSWRPRSLEISDATGNKWTPYERLTSITHTGDKDELTFAGTLWHGEAAWKLRAEFSRISGFDPGETWTVRGITVPGARQAIPLTDSTTMGETKLSLVAITGANAQQPGNLRWQAERLAQMGMVTISVRATPWIKGQNLSLLEVWDDRGRKVDIRSGDDWNEDNVFGLVIPEGAKSLICTFALHQSRFVEFLAAPDYAGKNLAGGVRR